MASKAARRRNKKAAAISQEIPSQRKAQGLRVVGRKSETATPTPERMARGVFVMPPKEDRRSMPMIDLAHDMIGELLVSRKITTSQEQAARVFQQLRAGYVAELGTQGYKSCLAGGVGGYDDSDGNAAVIAAYRGLERKIGRVKSACLTIETEKLAGQRPSNLDVLRNALDCVANA